jgi:hypothetical protein
LGACAGARKIGPNLQHFRREAVSWIVLFALSICKLGKQLDFFERLMTSGDPGAGLGERLVDGRCGGVVPVRTGESAGLAECGEKADLDDEGLVTPVEAGMMPGG